MNPVARLYAQDLCEFVDSETILRTDSRVKYKPGKKTPGSSSRKFFKEYLQIQHPLLWDLADFSRFNGSPFFCHEFVMPVKKTIASCSLLMLSNLQLFQGISFPMFYLGSRGAPFYWHLEDQNLFRFFSDIHCTWCTIVHSCLLSAFLFYISVHPRFGMLSRPSSRTRL